MAKTVLDKGKLRKLPSNTTTDYKFTSPSDFFSVSSNLITGLSGVSGARVMIGDKASLQALSLVHREAPLVQSAPSKDEPSFNESYGKDIGALYSKTAGTVTKVTPTEIHVTDDEGKGHKHYMYEHFLSGRKSFLHNESKVVEGDRVKKGTLLATSNYTDDHGKLAVGANLKTAIMPYRSLNFEDAYVVTESGANKLQAEQIISERLEKVRGIEHDKNKYVSLFPNKFYNEQLTKIDGDGVVKKGQIVHTGDPIILAFAPRSLKSLDLQLGKLSKVLRNAFSDNSLTWGYEYPGEVVDVSKTGDLVTVNIKTRRGVEVGDKISIGQGAKGVVGAVLPDAQAPTGADGKPVDLILNSMSITSRVAPGLMTSMATAKVAQKLGKPLKMPGFQKGSAVDEVKRLMEEHGVSDMEKLYDPVVGKELNVFTGPLYVNRLIHIAEDKVSARSQGIGYDWNMQPSKSTEESAKRVGNLATTVLLSNDAKAILRDIGTVRSTRNDEFWNNLKLGLPVPMPKVPFVFDKFMAFLRGAGIKVDQKGDRFNILPQTNKDIEKLSVGHIENADTYRVKGENLIAEKGGLFDPIKTGLLGDKYNHVDLHMEIPNPISEEYFRKLIGVTKKQYEDMLVSGELVKKLKEMNVEQEMEKLKKYIKSGKRTDRDNAVKSLSFLTNLTKVGIHPGELVLNKIPIIPAQYRPMVVQGNQVFTAGINELYKDLMLTNTAVQDSAHAPEDLARKAKLELYNAAKAAYGLGDPVSQKSKTKGFRGLLSTALGIRGGSAKESFFQAKVVNKPIDLVGRAVLVPDTKLDLDEASVPQDIIWTIYKPFIISRLVQKGLPAVRATEYVEKRNPIATQALSEELRVRPGIVSRDPMLHKFNMQGYYLKPNVHPKDKTVKLNPLVYKSYNADNDGDQLNIQVPATEESKQEVIEKLLPSKNLISHRNFNPMFTPTNESALGLFIASREDNGGKAQKFHNVEDMVNAFKRGELEVGDRVEI